MAGFQLIEAVIQETKMAQPARAYAHLIDRSHQERAQLNVHLRVTLIPRSGTEPVEGELVSIGPDQMFVRAPVAISPGKTVHLRFRMLSKRVCEARGQVIWQQDGGFGVVLEERNAAMDSFLQDLGKLSPNLRQLYLADVLYPRIDLAL
jgi:hypothetical protein